MVPNGPTGKKGLCALRRTPPQFFLLLALGFLPACSTTPGDAAQRSGHPGHPGQAALLYRKGAEGGDAAAAFKLAQLVQAGEVSPETYGPAGNWYARACDLGDAVGCHNAGIGYEYGQLGFPQDYAQARTFYRRAAERGYIPSQYNLGSLYANQYFTDDVEGLKWLLVAQANGRKCLLLAQAQGTPVPAPCTFVVDDPPGHVARTKMRMTDAQVHSAEAQASALNTPMILARDPHRKCPGGSRIAFFFPSSAARSTRPRAGPDGAPVQVPGLFDAASPQTRPPSSWMTTARGRSTSPASSAASSFRADPDQDPSVRVERTILR